jgi:hypothetical protein
MDKIASGTNQTKSADWYTWEINRLEKTNEMLRLLKDVSNFYSVPFLLALMERDYIQNPPKFADIGDTSSGELDNARTALKDCMKTFVEKRQKWQAPASKYISFSSLHLSTNLVTNRSCTSEDDQKKAKEERQQVVTEYQNAQTALHEAQSNYDKLNLKLLTNQHKTTQNGLFEDIAKPTGFATTQIASNERIIEQYKAAREALLKGDASGAQDGPVQKLAEDVGIPKPLPDPADAAPKDDATGKIPLADYFTPITVEISATSENKSTDMKSNSYSFGASASWGWFGGGGSGSQSTAHSNAMSELASSSLKISFEVMRVDIYRSWLRPELFYDEDLVTGPGIK